MFKPYNQNKKNTKKNAGSPRVVYLLILVVILHFIYPITQYGTPYLVLYQVLYCLMFVAGIYISRKSMTTLVMATTTAMLFLITHIIYSFDPTNKWKIFFSYLSTVSFQGTNIYILLLFVFSSKTVDREVIYAAATIYLLIGAAFVPMYGILETLQPGSFIDGATSQKTVNWQQLVYYSYANLTSGGFGDIKPVSWWARAFENLESVIGVLYITILMARLMALYVERYRQ